LQARTLGVAGAGLRHLDVVPDDDVVFPDTSLSADAPFFDDCHLNESPDFSDVQFGHTFEDSGSSGWDSFNDVSLISGSEGTQSEIRTYETEADM
jgi:hypothetical protein